MHFSIRYLTEYNYDTPVTDNLTALRVRPATNSSQRCDEFHTRIEPEARVSRHLDYFGTEVLEFGIPTSHEQLTIDVRGRVGEPAEPVLYRRGGRVRAPVARPTGDRRPGRPGRGARGRQPAGDAGAVVRARSGPLRIPPGSDLRGLERPRPARSGRGRVPGLRAPLAGAAAPPRHRRALRLRLSVGGSGRRGNRLGRGRHPRLAGGAAPRHERPRRARVGERRSHEPHARGRAPREDRPRTLLLRRPPREESLHGWRPLGADRRG